jgi:hypothetical protein
MRVTSLREQVLTYGILDKTCSLFGEDLSTSSVPLIWQSAAEALRRVAGDELWMHIHLEFLRQGVDLVDSELRNVCLTAQGVCFGLVQPLWEHCLSRVPYSAFREQLYKTNATI